MSDDLFIVAVPELRRATPGTIIRYELHSKSGAVTRDTPARWFAHNDPKSVTLTRLAVFPGPTGIDWEDAEWEFPGHHSVVCVVTIDSKFVRVVYEQWVVPTAEFLVNGPTLPRAKEDAAAFADQVGRMVDLLIAAGAKFPPQTEEQKKEFEDDVAKFEQERAMVNQRLESTKFFVRHPFTAEHFDAQTQRRTPLRVFISQVAFKKWLIVDWTNPLVRGMTGEYPGFGDTPEDAVRSAIDNWNSNNRYPTGGIVLSIPAVRDLPAITENFETDGDAFWDDVSTFFDWFGLAAAVVAGVVTLVAPVPGSRIVSAAIWTSILSSSAAAVVNIGTRIDEGFSNWRANAFDTLTIVGNLFGVGGLVWSRGATVLVNTEKGLVKAAIIGQFGTDAIQGVLLADEFVQQFKDIESNPNLTPRERSSQLLELFRSAAVSGTLLYFSVKATKADLENLSARGTSVDATTPEERLLQLSDPDVEVDLTKLPVSEGSAAADTHTTKVQIDQEMDVPTPAGHAKTPRVRTPEEAFKDIMGHKHHADLAKDVPAIRAQNPQLANLTDDEIIAIRGYTSDLIKPEFGNMEDFRRINNALRLEDTQQLALLKPYIDLIKSGLTKLPNVEADLHRIVRGVSAEEIRAQFIVGKDWTDRAFMSTSFRTLDDARVYMHLLGTKSGRNIKAMSKFPSEGEGEVLFPPSAAVFEVLNVHEFNGFFMIVLKEK